MMYQLTYNPFGGSPVIKRLPDLTFIPPDPDNTSYQQYLAWLAEGNTPLPADEPEAAQ